MKSLPDLRNESEYKNASHERISYYALKVQGEPHHFDTPDTCVSFIIVTIKNWLCYRASLYFHKFEFTLNHHKQKHRFSNVRIVFRSYHGDQFEFRALDLEIFWEHITDIQSLAIMNRVMMHFALLQRDKDLSGLKTLVRNQ